MFEEELRQLENTEEKLNANLSQLVASMNTSSNALNAASKDLTSNLDSAMLRTYKQIDQLLADAVTYLSGTISQIRDITEKVPKVLNSHFLYPSF